MTELFNWSSVYKKPGNGQHEIHFWYKPFFAYNVFSIQFPQSVHILLLTLFIFVFYFVEVIALFTLVVAFFVLSLWFCFVLFCFSFVVVVVVVVVVVFVFVFVIVTFVPYILTCICFAIVKTVEKNIDALTIPEC